MLLDQKRTKRMVQVVAVLTSIAFVGVIFVVLFAILLGGGSSGTSHGGVDIVGEAQDRVDEMPMDADARQDLASALATDGDFEGAIEQQREAVRLDPDDYDRVSTLIGLQIQQNDLEGALDSVQSFTMQNRDQPDPYLDQGSLAERLNRLPLARLSYQRFLQLAPDSSNAPLARQRIQEIDSGGGGPPAAEAAPPADHGG